MISEETFEAVVCIRSNDGVARHHLMPLALHPRVTRIWVVRHAEIEYGPIPKVTYCVVGDRWRLIRLCKMLQICIRLGRRNNVQLFSSFNPFPYGILAFLAGRLTGKRVQIGFIGSDWYRDGKTWLGRFLMRYIRRADFISVPGKHMVQELVEDGFAPQQVKAIPHGTDLDRFPLAGDEEKVYTGLFVGRLIPLKRVDVIINAFGIVQKKYPDARFCIVGDGQCQQALKTQVQRLDLQEHIDFVGYQTDVYPYMAKSRMLWMASEYEGFPSVIVEAMATGVVPVTTAVGCIADCIVDGVNGVLILKSDARDFADAVLTLLNDEKKFDRIRKLIIDQRKKLSHRAGTEVWDRWVTGAN